MTRQPAVLVEEPAESTVCGWHWLQAGQDRWCGEPAAGDGPGCADHQDDYAEAWDQTMRGGL